MLIINNDLVFKVLTMGECIQAQEEAFKKLPTGGAIHRPRIDMYFPCRQDDGQHRNPVRAASACLRRPSRALRKGLGPADPPSRQER